MQGLRKLHLEFVLESEHVVVVKQQCNTYCGYLKRIMFQISTRYDDTGPHKPFQKLRQEAGTHSCKTLWSARVKSRRTPLAASDHWKRSLCCCRDSHSSSNSMTCASRTYPTSAYECKDFVMINTKNIDRENFLAPKIDKHLTQITASHNSRHAWYTNSLICRGLWTISHRHSFLSQKLFRLSPKHLG